MSSLTSIGINKNKKGFAPKISTRRKERKPVKSNQESTPKPSSKTTQGASQENTPGLIQGGTQESIREATPELTQATTQEPTQVTTQATTQATQENTQETSQFNDIQPNVPASASEAVDLKSESLTQEELAINANRKRRRRRPSNTAIDAPSPIQRLDQIQEDELLLLKEEAMTPDFDAMVDDEYVEPKEEEQQRELPKKRKDKQPATKKKPAKKSKTSSSRGAAISIGIGVPGPSSSAPAVAEVVPVEEDQSNKKKRDGKKRDRFAYRLVENMRTLDDITNDPASADNLEKPMSHFTKDIDGIVSKAFKEMETAREEELKKKTAKMSMNDEELEALRKKEEEAERAAAEKKRLEKEREEERRKKDAENHVIQDVSNAVQVRIVNGEIVLDTDTLVVERQSGDSHVIDESMEVVEETNMTRKVNSATYGKRKQSARWDAVETAQFYECLSQFGTDFEMISKVMPGRTRNQIRLKFNREEKLKPEKVTEYLITRKKPMDLEKFKEIAGIDLEVVPDDFHELQLA